MHLLDEFPSASHTLAAVGEFCLDASQLVALAVELGLEREGSAHSSLVIGHPAACIQCQPLLLLKIQLEALQDVLKPGNQAERRQVGLDGDFLVMLSALQDQGDPEGSGEGRMSLADQIEAAEASDAPLPLVARTLGEAQLRDEQSAAVLRSATSLPSASNAKASPLVVTRRDRSSRMAAILSSAVCRSWRAFWISRSGRARGRH